VLWPLEVLNALTVAERRGRLDAARRQLLAGFLRDLPISLDHETATQAWTTTAHLAERFRLTLYDAAYLELAQRLALPLATLDGELRAAAQGLGVPLLGA
jgi:predicted nucleic acid-binding protein